MSRQKEINPDAPYQSPRATAYLTGLSLWYIREGCKAGTIPHIRVGRDYRINMPLLLEQMNRESRNAASGCSRPESGKAGKSLHSTNPAQNYNMLHDSEQ